MYDKLVEMFKAQVGTLGRPAIVFYIKEIQKLSDADTPGAEMVKNAVDGTLEEIEQFAKEMLEEYSIVNLNEQYKLPHFERKIPEPVGTWPRDDAKKFILALVPECKTNNKKHLLYAISLKVVSDTKKTRIINIAEGSYLGFQHEIDKLLNEYDLVMSNTHNYALKERV